MLVKRPGGKSPLEITVKPQKLGGKPTIGIISSHELQIAKEKDALVFLPDSAAEMAMPSFCMATESSTSTAKRSRPAASSRTS